MLVFVSFKHRYELDSEQRNEEIGSPLLVWLIQPGKGWDSGGGGAVGWGSGLGATELIDPQLQVAELENNTKQSETCPDY